MSKHRQAAIILILLVLFTVSAASCAGDDAVVSGMTETADENTPETTADDNPEPDLPVSDFSGESFTFLLRLTNHAYDEEYVYTGEYDGEVVNDAIYDRNRAVEEKLNINIEAIYDSTVSATAQKAIMANDSSFEVLWDSKNAMPTLITSGYLVDFKTVPHVNLTAGYWDKNASEQLAILNKLYFMPSD